MEKMSFSKGSKSCSYWQAFKTRICIKVSWLLMALVDVIQSWIKAKDASNVLQSTPHACE